jgi:hypothetical protein
VKSSGTLFRPELIMMAGRAVDPFEGKFHTVKPQESRVLRVGARR